MMNGKNEFRALDHTFVICAYKESQFLEECIESIMNQTVRGRVIICTATPNAHIENIAKKYEIPLYINSNGGEIAKDWNFGIKTARTDLVTIAHQDDTYAPKYLETILERCNEEEKPLIAFSDYGEIRNASVVTDNRLLKIKKIMLLPLRVKRWQRNVFIRRRILSFGSAICCPSVTYVKCNLPEPIFKSGYRSDLDWQAWEYLSRRKGSFVYCNQVLMNHRIHEESATTAIIGDNDRYKEDFEMFQCFWPKWIAKILISFYKDAEKSNQID